MLYGWLNGHIDENFCNSKISLSVISEKYAYNPKYLSGYFKKSFGIGINRYITTLRIQKACSIIEAGEKSLKSIAFQCGFSEPFYFSRVFKKTMGYSPTEHIRIESQKEPNPYPPA